jgi:hypothetical protein
MRTCRGRAAATRCPWQYAGREVWVRDRSGEVDVRYGGERIARHARAPHQHAVVTVASTHQEIPLEARGLIQESIETTRDRSHPSGPPIWTTWRKRCAG